MTAVTSAELAARWRTLRTTKPGSRTRDAADELGVSEVELVATMVGEGATRLSADAAAVLHALPAVGRCMALTRNDHAVSEVRGRYGGVQIGPRAGLVIGERIDLRVFARHWQHLYAIDEAHPQRPGERRRSIHVFDASGTAVHKIYLEPTGDPAAWDAMVATRSAPGPLVLEAVAGRRRETPDAEIDRAGLLAGWDAMTDTHEFIHLLSAHGVSRPQALRLAGEERAREVPPVALEQLLHETAAGGDEIMIFVGNRGCIQIFSGAVERIVRHGPWINVLDPDFNLHLRSDRIAASWVVSKPTSAGVVSSLELFDARGETIALVFRKRDDRERAEDERWRTALARLGRVRP